MEPVIIFIGLIILVWTTLMGNVNHWNYFERLGSRYGPAIGIVLMILGCLL